MSREEPEQRVYGSEQNYRFLVGSGLQIAKIMVVVRGAMPGNALRGPPLDNGLPGSGFGGGAARSEEDVDDQWAMVRDLAREVAEVEVEPSVTLAGGRSGRGADVGDAGGDHSVESLLEEVDDDLLRSLGLGGGRHGSGIRVLPSESAPAAGARNRRGS